MDKIHHIAIQVDDIQKGVDYYTKNFDCEISYQDPTWAMLDFANIKLALVLPNQHPPHIAISQDNASRWGELTKHRDGVESIYIKDCFENEIEILSEESLLKTKS